MKRPHIVATSSALVTSAVEHVAAQAPQELRSVEFQLLQIGVGLGAVGVPESSHWQTAGPPSPRTQNPDFRPVTGPARSTSAMTSGALVPPNTSTTQPSELSQIE